MVDNIHKKAVWSSKNNALGGRMRKSLYGNIYRY